ncbi:MAG: hypothetical protein P9X22_02400 [Candidatus Zapsychrus exili]|nr:hypothetical protein [Candidatus Zapsychrus exili]
MSGNGGGEKEMKKIITIYLLFLLVVILFLGLAIHINYITIKSETIKISVYCSLFGLLGGVSHCLRSVYLHTCVLKNWDLEWVYWYFIRPVISMIMGFMSMIFLKAGLLALSSDSLMMATSSKTVLYLAVAFLAGYNVQNFLKKIDAIGKATLGIEKKREESNGD